MWKVDYGCIDLVPPTPPLFNLFLSGGWERNDQPKGQKESTTRYTKVPFFPHTMQGSHTTMYRPHTKYATLPPIQICTVWEEAIRVLFLLGAEFLRGEI